MRGPKPVAVLTAARPWPNPPRMVGRPPFFFMPLLPKSLVMSPRRHCPGPGAATPAATSSVYSQLTLSSVVPKWGSKLVSRDSQNLERVEARVLVIWGKLCVGYGQSTTGTIEQRTEEADKDSQ